MNELSFSGHLINGENNVSVFKLNPNPFPPSPPFYFYKTRESNSISKWNYNWQPGKENKRNANAKREGLS